MELLRRANQTKFFFCHEPENVSCCLLLHVKEIQTENMRGERNELDMIWYLMKNFEVLGKFSFDISPSKKNLQQEILMFPRDSSLPGLCKIEVLWYACFLVSQSYNISPFEAVNTFTFILWTESNFWVKEYFVNSVFAVKTI